MKILNKRPVRKVLSPAFYFKFENLMFKLFDEISNKIPFALFFVKAFVLLTLKSFN